VTPWRDGDGQLDPKHIAQDLRAFEKADEGIRTLDLRHGKATL
jgi:hypothetical protein